MSDENPEISSISKVDKSSSIPDEKGIVDKLPEEVEEALKSLPPESSKMVRGMFMSMVRETTISRSSSISNQINSTHLDKLIENDDREDERRHQRSQSTQTTSRLAIGAVLFLVIIVLTYAGITKKEQLSEKIIIAGISGIGGLGAGYAIGKRKE
jgi:hypothetical protein